MDQAWFEMREVRRRKLATAVWIPLRAVHSIEKIGRVGHLGYKEEFFGLGSVAVLLEKRAEAQGLRWMDVGISHEHRSCVQNGRYIPADAYEWNEEVLGLHLVLVQHTNREERREWHLHQDLVIALGLKREGECWIAPNEDYTEVARLHRDSDGLTFLLEARAEHLRDYLCARGMALYVTSYRNRAEVVDDAGFISWPANPLRQVDGGDRWEGRVTAIHEGGMPYGESMAVFHMSRTDVDPEEDVPSFDLPRDDQVVSRSWTRTAEGRKLYMVQGEFWRNEWVDPADSSPRVRRDEPSATVFFITDSAGSRESKASLKDGSRWLWFRPEVISAMVNRRGGALGWYTRDTGSVRCSPDYDVHFGVNRLGLVNVYAKDIAMLPEWQQSIWAGHNVGPEGGVSEELLASQMRAEPASTQAPERFLGQGLSLLNEIASEKLGFRLFRDHEQRRQLLTMCHRFRSVDRQGFFSLAKDLARLTADSIDAAAIQRIVPPPKGTKWGSLKSLENLLARRAGPDGARALLGPLVGIYELRHADAHLGGNSVVEALSLVGVETSLPPVMQGYQLMHACVSSLYRMAEALKSNNARDAGK